MNLVMMARPQATASVIVIVGLGLNTGAPDTGNIPTVRAFKPDGTENTTFTAPTIAEQTGGSGIWKFTFANDAANPLFTLAGEDRPYTLLIKTATSGGTWYRTVQIFITNTLIDDVATATALAVVDGVCDDVKAEVLTHPTLAEIEASTVLATASALATVDTNVDTLVTNLAVVDGIVDDIKAEVLTHPTLAEIEASTVLAMDTDIQFLVNVIKNKKEIRKESSTWYLCVRDSGDSSDIVKKAVKDSSGADITDIAAGQIAKELASSV